MKKCIFLITMLGLLLACSIQGQTKREIGNLILENIPEFPKELSERLDQYQNSRGATPSSWSPEGDAMLMSTRFGPTAQIHMISKPGGARKQLTFFREPVSDGNFCPNPAYNGFMFTKDAGGNEFRQLFWFDLSTGRYEMISDGGRTQNSNVQWSEDGTRFLYTSTRRNKRDYDLFLGSMTDMKNVRPVLEREGSWSPMDWSTDGKTVIVRNYISANKSFLYLLDLESGELGQVNPDAKEDVAYGNCAWTSDASGFYYVSDEGGEFSTLKYYEVKTKRSVTLTSGIPWDVEDLIINKQRSEIVFGVNENGVFRLYNLKTATRRYASLQGLPEGLLGPSSFHPDGSMFSMVINSPKSPNDIYTYELAGSRLTQWTYSEVGGLDNSKFISPVLIEYETFDQVNGVPLKIPAFYYKPAVVSGRIPVVIDIHGGPEGQSVPRFDAFRSFLTNELGVAVIEPNVRGSSGYGKSYLKMDNGYKREESVRDIGKLLDWIANRPELDASRVALSGGSYGGYMVLAALTHYNDRIRCGIDVVGISNFVTFLKNTEDYRKDLRRVEYGDERDPEMRAFLEKISPANNAAKITKPLLIVQGLNDPRVPASEAEQMKARMLEQGNEVWYLLARDEGHGFRKKENWTIEQMTEILFLQKYLLE